MYQTVHSGQSRGCASPDSIDSAKLTMVLMRKRTSPPSTFKMDTPVSSLYISAISSHLQKSSMLVSLVPCMQLSAGLLVGSSMYHRLGLKAFLHLQQVRPVSRGQKATRGYHGHSFNHCHMAHISVAMVLSRHAGQFARHVPCLPVHIVLNSSSA